MCCILIELKIMHKQCNDIWSRPSLRTPAAWIMTFTILADHSLVIITICLFCIIHVPVYIWRGEEILHFHYLATSWHMIPFQVVHDEIYKFGRPFLGHHYYTKSVWTIPRRREKNFLRNTSHFSQKYQGHHRLTMQMLHTKFSWDWPSSSYEEDVNARRTTHVAWRRTLTHSNRSSEWARWPKSWANVKVKRLSSNWKILHVSQGILMWNIKALELTIQLFLTRLKY